MCQAVLSPNLTKKFQWEVSQIADNRFPYLMLLGGLSVNLNHLKSTSSLHIVTHLCQFMAQNSKIWGVKKNWQLFDISKIAT